jgi:hypothetical protein
VYVRAVPSLHRHRRRHRRRRHLRRYHCFVALLAKLSATQRRFRHFFKKTPNAMDIAINLQFLRRCDIDRREHAPMPPTTMRHDRQQRLYYVYNNTYEKKQIIHFDMNIKHTTYQRLQDDNIHRVWPIIAQHVASTCRLVATPLNTCLQDFFKKKKIKFVLYKTPKKTKTDQRANDTAMSGAEANDDSAVYINSGI